MSWTLCVWGPAVCMYTCVHPQSNSDSAASSSAFDITPPSLSPMATPPRTRLWEHDSCGSPQEHMTWNLQEALRCGFLILVRGPSFSSYSFLWEMTWAEMQILVRKREVLLETGQECGVMKYRAVTTSFSVFPIPVMLQNDNTHKNKAYINVRTV